ncbi:MAG TPA: type II secretion system F family protein [Mycobacteriales bacterium]|nr:type II secretion system F family protein [Mycobacteriales bacterium]
MSPFGGLLGLIAAAGLGLAISRLPAFRRPTLADRLAPYVRDAARPSALLTQRPAGRPGVLAALLAPLLADLAGAVERFFGGTASVRRRLTALGSPLGVDQFRQEQVLWGAGAGAVGLALLALRLGTGFGAPAITLAGLTVLAVLGGVLARDLVLTRAVRRREERITLELPTVAELLALAVGAGESPVAALERATRRAGGELSRELRLALADARSGTPFVTALGAVAQRTSLPALARFVDGMSIALQRGTPLAEVLRAQAVDVREEGRRALLESGGKREIAMMAPVVFLVLPVTILFALFPGAVTLTSIAR